MKIQILLLLLEVIPFEKIVEANNLNWVKLIYPSAQISFEIKIDNGTISPNAVLGGTVHVGGETHLRIDTVIKNNVTIGKGIFNRSR